MGTGHEDRAALVILANFLSPPAVGLGEESVPRQWSEQASRKLWLTQPGYVVITPVPVTAPFRRYVFDRLGIADGSVTVITVPETPHVPMAEALAQHGLLDTAWPFSTSIRCGARPGRSTTSLWTRSCR